MRAAGQPQPVHFADHGVAVDAAEFGGNLARREAIVSIGPLIAGLCQACFVMPSLGSWSFPRSLGAS